MTAAYEDDDFEFECISLLSRMVFDVTCNDAYRWFRHCHYL